MCNFRNKTKLLKNVLTVAVATALLLLSFPMVFVSAVEVSSQSELSTAIANNDDIELKTDLVLSSWSAPVTDYTGTFNGNGHIISGLSGPLLESVSGSVSDLGVVADESVVIKTDALLASVVTGNITNCFAYGSFSLPLSPKNVGGLIGTLSGGMVTSCFSCVSIEGTGDPDAYVGGLIGKIEAGTVESCYSSGDISVASGYVAGFANQIGGTVSDTYTSCQLVKQSITSKPSGVNGLYDNQLSVLRENVDNFGLTTPQLVSTDALSTAFVVTSAQYPALHTFYSDIWEGDANNIVRISVAVAAFSDVDADVRKEPTAPTFFARADYLTPDVYVDRTNAVGFLWSVDTEYCKVYDTVPTTSSVFSDVVSTGTSADLLRARLCFSQSVSDAKMTVTCGDFRRTWHLTASSVNPYFAQGSGTESSVYGIQSLAHLDNVRYYTMLGNTHYELLNDITCGEFDAIERLNGSFNGNQKTLSDLELVNRVGNDIALFVESVEGSSVTDLLLKNVNAQTAAEGKVAALIASADTTQVSGVLLGGENALKSAGVVGGLIAEATNCTLSNLLVSVEATGLSACGGLVGHLSGGSLSASGVTGYVAGGTLLGGLIGYADTTASTVNHCYSTAAVFSETSESVTKIGGLIGDNQTTTISNSYAAALVDAPSATSSMGALVGNGNVGDNCYYDADLCLHAGSVGTGLDTAAMIGESESILLDSAVWTQTAEHYPQIRVFVNNASFAELSSLSTIAAYFQKYWNDSSSSESTTGWIPSAYSENGRLELADITELTAYCDGLCDDLSGEKVYAVSGGFGFEAASGSRRIALRAADPEIGVRVIAIVRTNGIALSYTVVGADGIRTYMELSFGESADDMQSFQVMSVSGSEAKRLYDIPEGALLKVRVQTVDDYEVDTVSVNGTLLTKSADSDVYYSEVGLDTDALVTVTLKERTPAWGLRRQTY